MNRSHIPGFPNPMPEVDWLEDLPIFKDEKKDNDALHLVRFHMHVHSLKVQFPEDCLMRMFMTTLEGKAWSWYKSLENGSIYSLASFHDELLSHFLHKCFMLGDNKLSLKPKIQRTDFSCLTRVFQG